MTVSKKSLQVAVREKLKSAPQLKTALKRLEPTLDDVREQALTLVSRGCKPQTALRACGVTAEIEKSWRERSRQQTSDDHSLWTFFRDLEVTKNKFKAGLISKIATNDDWKSAAWLLERQYRNEFGKEITLTPGKLNTMSDEEIDRALKQLEVAK